MNSVLSRSAGLLICLLLLGPASSAQGRPDCPAPDRTCFVDDLDQSNFRTEDMFGNVMLARIPWDQNEFIRIDSKGRRQAHLQSREVELAVCPVQIFSCRFRPFPGLLRGSGRLTLNASLTMFNAVSCPSVLRVEGRVGDEDTGATYEFSRSFVRVKDEDGGCRSVGDTFELTPVAD